MEDVTEELADVVIYCLIISNILDIDLGFAVRRKQSVNIKRWGTQE